MLDANSLIGLSENEARKILTAYGYTQIVTKQNFESNEKCNLILVCAARLEGQNKATLVCGAFREINKEI